MSSQFYGFSIGIGRNFGSGSGETFLNNAHSFGEKDITLNRALESDKDGNKFEVLYEISHMNEYVIIA